MQAFEALLYERASETAPSKLLSSTIDMIQEASEKEIKSEQARKRWKMAIKRVIQQLTVDKYTKKIHDLEALHKARKGIVTEYVKRLADMSHVLLF